MSTPVPTLGSSGFVTSAAVSADRLFSYYLIIDKSQSDLHYDSIVSLPNSLAETGSHPTEIKQRLEQDLDSLYHPYFDKSQVEVTVTDKSKALSGSEAILELEVDISVQKGNQQYSLQRLVTVVNGRATRNQDRRNL